MKLVILGTGNVAETLGTMCKSAGHQILLVYGRTPQKAERLAKKLSAEAVSNLSHIATDAQLYLVALSDEGTTNLWQHWHTEKGLVVHTAGSVPMHVLKNVSTNCGVMYPLQSLRAPHLPQASIPFLVNANTPDDLALLTDFARSISPTVVHSSDEERLHFHLAAVLVNNFTNHLYKLAADYCSQHSLDFNLLYPLILETAKRVEHVAPALVQTGPATRKDAETMNRHLELLKHDPTLTALYQLLSASIMHSDKK